MVYEGLDFSTTALFAWPVEWLDRKRSKPDMEYPMHVTNTYLPDIKGMSKVDLLATVYKYERRKQGYEVAKVKGVDAFGPKKDHPVLLLDLYDWWEMRDLRRIFDEEGIKYASNWAFNPHVTVDLTTALNPPKRVLLKPLELWYGDDEPVAV